MVSVWVFGPLSFVHNAVHFRSRATLTSFTAWACSCHDTGDVAMPADLGGPGDNLAELATSCTAGVSS